MYATRLDNGIYHLVIQNTHETVCGLKISRLSSQLPYGLHLVPRVPGNRMICKHCERISGQRDGDKDQD
jgi:hypothetical protein